MDHRKYPHFSAAILLWISLAILIPAVALGQQTRNPARDGGGPIQIRVLCSQIVPDQTAMSLLQKGEVVHDIDLVRAMVSDPLGFSRGEMVLARRAVEGENIEPLIRIPIPNVGTRFILALFPASVADPARIYEHVLVRTDNLNFKTSDLFMMNLTRVPIGGTVGTRRFRLSPRQVDVVTPDPPAGDGRAHPFSDTRWPRSNAARVYLFFLPDPERQSINFISFREYAPFP